MKDSVLLQKKKENCTLPDHYIWNVPSKMMGWSEVTSFFSLPVVGMATCCFSSLQDLLPLLGRWWTQPPHTHLHHYHLCRPPLPRPPWSPGPCQRPRSRRMRSISIWPSKTARSTGTKTRSCKRRTCCRHPLSYNVRSLMLLLLLQMSPWRPGKMCALCTIRGNTVHSHVLLPKL